MSGWTALVAILVGAILVAAAILLYRALRGGAHPLIPSLDPAFFFWLGMIDISVLLLMALIYNVHFRDSRARLFGGILPIAVPWFGALGAVTISLEGVFFWNDRWDRKYNYWHIGRPLFGAVLGIVAFFIFVVIGAASGATPKFFDGSTTALAKDCVTYYILAFLVGYREQTFRELIKRATDLILKPGTQPNPAPAVTLKVGGVMPAQVNFPNVTAGQTSSVTVEVQNSGDAPLIGPAITVSPIDPTPASTFAVANDRVTAAGDLAPGEAKTVDITFAPQTTGSFAGSLTVTATNLAAPKTVRLAGQGV
jgi:hypothetical protein